MSTNYYAKWPNQPADEEGLHIGKHSGGCEFLWRAHKDLSIRSTQEWRRFLDHPWVTIVAEYGSEREFGDFWQLATTPGGKPTQDQAVPEGYGYRTWRDADGYPFADYEFC